MVLKIETRAEVLRNYLDMILILHDEAILHFLPDKVECSVVDASHVAMVKAELNSKVFDKYEANDVKLGVDVNKIQGFMKSLKSQDPVEVEHDEDENMLILRAGPLTRSMPLIDVSTIQETTMPQLVHVADVVIKTSEVERGIRAAEKVTEQISFIITTNEFQLLGKSERERVNLKIPSEKLESFKCDEKEIKSTYSLEFLTKMIKVSSVSEFVHMKLSNNYPLQLELDISDSLGKVVYLLAPRMDE